MLFSCNHSNVLPDVYFNGKKLEWVKSVNYLGISIESDLSFKTQCKNVVSRLSQAHGIMWAISSFFPRKILLKIFYALVYPVITQDIILWGGAYRSYLTNINTIIIKILRCIFNANKLDNNFRPIVRTNTLYTELNVMN